MKQLILSLALVALAACAALPPPPTLTPDTPGASSGDIGDWLDSPNRDVRDHALDTVRANPGAYLPATFAWVAHELHQRGETVEAAKWSEFGSQRLSVDIAFMTPLANDDQRAFLARLPQRYADDLGEDFRAAYHALPAGQLHETFEEVQSLQASTPRRYAPTWAFDPGHAYANNWLAEPASWSAEEQARIAALYQESLPAFQQTFERIVGLHYSPIIRFLSFF